ncbi:cutinase-domain-containing protein [Camillea tinctor]|nr:cutinase-domain-containing protein [Camillea tinctor]
MPSPTKLARSTALASLAILSSLPQATSVANKAISRREVTVSANEWDDILKGKEGAQCAELAVIFARGTFDTGNLGVWVGGPFYDALHSKAAEEGIRVAVQGVSKQDYPADLPGYILEGGSNSCAAAMGRDIQKYHERCPDAKIAAWGWSQGSLCARKSLSHLGPSPLLALGLFGDPLSAWDPSAWPPPRPSTRVLSYCSTAPPDPLCRHMRAEAPSDMAGYTTWVLHAWSRTYDARLSRAQIHAMWGLLTVLTAEAAKLARQFAADVVRGRFRRWMLTPEHFWYGLDGTVERAAAELVEVYRDSGEEGEVEVEVEVYGVRVRSFVMLGW